MATASEPKAIEKRKPAEAAAPEGGEPSSRRGWLSWVVGWLLVPGTVVGLIFGAGVLLGAHRHDGWYARTVVWLADVF
jgi:hypothetical protein